MGWAPHYYKGIFVVVKSETISQCFKITCKIEFYHTCLSNYYVCFFFHSFMFDEPSSYLDVKQRLKAAITIRSLINPDR